MSHKISYSYIFDDEMERVCKCFTNYYLFTEVTFSGFVTNAKKIKGDNLEEIGTIIELKFKNYYDFRIEIINVKKGPLYQNIVHKLIYLGKTQLEFYNVYQFYWNSCEKKTIFFYEYLFNDEFFEPLLRDEVIDKEKEQICNNVVQYLRTNPKDLNLTKGCLINSNIHNVWDFIKNGKILNEKFLNKVKFKTEFHGDFKSLDTYINIYAIDNLNNNNLFACLLVNKIFMTEDKIEVVLKCSNNNMLLPLLAVVFSIYKTSEEKCFLNLLINPYEHLSADTCNLFSKYFKKYLSIIKEHFNPKKK